MKINEQEYKDKMVKEFKSTFKKYYQDEDYCLELLLLDDYERNNMEIYNLHDGLFDIEIDSDKVIFLEKDYPSIDKNKAWDDYLTFLNTLSEKEKTTVNLDQMKDVFFEKREPSMLFNYTFNNCKILNYDEIKDKINNVSYAHGGLIFKYNDKFIAEFYFNEVGKETEDEQIKFIMEFASLDTLRVR